jgi:hypothetical protein
MDGMDSFRRELAPLPDHSVRSLPRKAILVLGMDRSGTSLMTYIIHRLGAALPSDLVGASRGNPSGHWEPRRLVMLNHAILGRFQRCWNDPRPLPPSWFRSPAALNAVRHIATEIEQGYGDAPLLVIKDPRLCQLLPLYLEALASLRIQPLALLQVRPANEVAQSLTDRDGMPAGLSHLLWLRAITDAELYSRHLPRVWVTFAQVSSGWRDVVNRIADQLHLQWPVPPLAAADSIEHFVRSKPLRMAAQTEDELLTETWSAIQGAICNDDAAVQAGFDKVRRLLRNHDQLYGEAMEYHLGQLHGSTCWRITAPLRALKLWLRRIRAQVTSRWGCSPAAPV